MTAGPEEPNALVQVERADGVSEPMVRATTLPLEEGLRAWPLAGKGRLVDQRDDAALRQAVRPRRGAGDRGGGRRADGGRGRGARRGAGRPGAGARCRPDSRRATASSRDTTALGIYDHGYVTAVQRRPTPRTEGRLWHIRAGRIVVATGRHGAAHRLRRRRPAGDHAGERGRALRRAVRRPARRQGRRLHEQRHHGRGDRRAARGRHRDRRRGRRPAGRAGGRAPAATKRAAWRDRGDRPVRWPRRDRRGGPAARVRRLEPERRAVEPGPRHPPLRRADRGVRPGSARAARPHGGGRRRRRRHRGPREDRAGAGSSRRPATTR